MVCDQINNIVFHRSFIKMEDEWQYLKKKKTFYKDTELQINFTLKEPGKEVMYTLVDIDNFI